MYSGKHGLLFPFYFDSEESEAGLLPKWQDKNYSNSQLVETF
jgi:hypothetical protein